MQHKLQHLVRYQRRPTHVVTIGGIPLGGSYPIRVQTMTNTPTADVEATAKQILAVHQAGAEYARVTVPTQKEAEALKELVLRLGHEHCTIPIVADIHFNPKLALLSAAIVSKVRINPGNFVDRKKGMLDYTPEQYQSELDRLRTKFLELISLCKKHGTALRIGTNHGSLSDRIMSRYGDTPEGMAESAMEFLRICKAVDFNEVVVSMKSSNTRVMVYATRILADKMAAEGMCFPLHLGVTEAGEGEDGRIKSAVGIGALLVDGLGDTIRVSLTEAPEAEIPVAQSLVKYIKQREGHPTVPGFGDLPIDLYEYKRRVTHAYANIGANALPSVLTNLSGDITPSALQAVGWNYHASSGWSFSDLAPDGLIVDEWPLHLPRPPQRNVWQYRGSQCNIFTSFEAFKKAKNVPPGALLIMLASTLDSDMLHRIKQEQLILVLESENANWHADIRSAVFRMMNADCRLPVVFKKRYRVQSPGEFQLYAATDMGVLFLDGLGDGLWLEANELVPQIRCIETAFGILQASRVRFSKTEYISCPSCGRTLFDLQTTTRKIQERTSHLKGLKIGVMGCIVNGPGEMADADYGYVGTGAGKVTLYKEKEVVKRNVSEHLAVEELINLIKSNGDWVEPTTQV